MIAEVADTHAALWRLCGDPRLSRNAREFIERASATGRKMAISSISLAEIVYLIEKGRIPKGAYENLNAVLSDPAGVFPETPVDNKVILGNAENRTRGSSGYAGPHHCGDRNPLRSSGYQPRRANPLQQAPDRLVARDLPIYKPKRMHELTNSPMARMTVPRGSASCWMMALSIQDIAGGG